MRCAVAAPRFDINGRLAASTGTRRKLRYRVQVQYAGPPLPTEHAAGQAAPQAARQPAGIDLPACRQRCRQPIPRHEVTVRQQAQAPTTASLYIEEQQALVESVAAHTGADFHPHRLLATCEHAAVARAIQAQYGAQRRELRGSRECLAHVDEAGTRHDTQRRHGRYPVTAMLADTLRPSAV